MYENTKSTLSSKEKKMNAIKIETEKIIQFSNDGWKVFDWCLVGAGNECQLIVHMLSDAFTCYYQGFCQHCCNGKNEDPLCVMT